MAFKPVNKPVSTEDFNDVSGFQLAAEHEIRKGVLTLRGTPVFDPTPDRNWKEATWSQTSQFIAVPNRSQPGGQWAYETDIFTSDLANGLYPFFGRTTPTGAFHFFEVNQPFFGGPEARRARRGQGPVFTNPGSTTPLAGRTGIAGRQRLGRKRIQEHGRGLLSLEAGTSETNYIFQNTSEVQSFWPDNIDNATGYTIELRASMQYGTSEMLIDDGSRKIILHMNEIGIYESSQLRCPMNWKNEPKIVRIGVKNDDIYFLNEYGDSFTGTSHLNAVRHASSGGKEIKIGHTGNTEGWLLLDYINQSILGLYLDAEDDTVYKYTLDAQTSYTPPLEHKRAVSSWISTVVKAGTPIVSTLKLQAQYKNTSNPTWTDFGSYTNITNEIQEIDLSTVPVDGDGSDTLRFAIVSQALNTSAKPSPIESLSVNARFEVSPFRLVPNYGSPSGNNTVTLRATRPFTMSASDSVYIAGVAVDPTRITHISTSEKEVVWPSGEVGLASVRIETPDTSSYFSETPYRYVETYNRVVDRYDWLDGVCGTRSAFRIKNEVPHGEVNLAYVSSPGIEAQSHIGLIDLSYLEDGNVVGGIEAPELLTSPNTSGDTGSFTYTSTPRTEELVIAGASAGWRELGVSSPLFYKYLIGRGRYYVTVEHTTLNKKELRDSITVHYQDGSPVRLEDYAWDIVTSTKDIDGVNLPSKVYSVVLLTNKKFVPDKTIFVTTNVVDRSNKFRLIQSYTEIVNPEPIVLLGATEQGYNVSIDHNGNFTLNIDD